MTQETQLKTAWGYAADDIGALQAGMTQLEQRVGDNPNLTTDQKATLVGAINEVNAKANTLANQLANMPDPESEIDDSQTVTDKTWSSSKISSDIQSATAALKQELLGGAGAAYDTFQELYNFITNNSDAIDAINQLTGSFVSFTAVQSLTDEQKTRARTNIGAASQVMVDAIKAITDKLGNVEFDYGALYETRRIAAGGPVIARA